MQIEFDPAKDKVNQAKHGISLGFAKQVLADPGRVETIDTRIDYGEIRIVAYCRAETDTRVWVCVYTPRGARGTKYRIISLRKANERETRQYYQPPH